LALTEAEAGPNIVPLLLAREDRRFNVMPGVDPLALLRAAGQLIRYGRIVSGGSTIAMQVARLLEPHPRTWLGKVHDIARALQLEAHLGHREVLRLYLTLAPMGGDIEGMRAASLLYFGREPAALTRSQAALLVGLPQSPARRRPDRHPDAAWQAASRVLQMAGDPMTLAPTPILPGAPPSFAPHLAHHFGGRAKTTLDGVLQAALEGLAIREAPWLGGETDLAAIIVRNADRAVLAYLGGADVLGPEGMVDMVRARRSPGSALKPFIYAMAFDRGLATPDTLLDDGVLRLGSYAPRDFDRVDHGSVTAAEALRQSLNRPAVRLLARVGGSYFSSKLQATGVRLLLPRQASPSAALALGGAGISLWDVAALYAGLAGDGRVGPLRLDPGAPVMAATRFASPHAAGQIADILRGQPPPPGAVADPGHRIAYKTGTSYGYRDAWAAGFTPGYTVVVWTGRRNNTPLPGITGRDTAAPLLFKIFALLPGEHFTPEPPRPVSASWAPALQRTTNAKVLRIMFPPGNVDLAYDPRARIDLRAAGGMPPYHWMIDGIPEGTAAALWAPSGQGFAHLTVVDSKGQSASEDVTLVPE
jgi:penicillin-binding protein 1C